MSDNNENNVEFTDLSIEKINELYDKILEVSGPFIAIDAYRCKGQMSNTAW